MKSRNCANIRLIQINREEAGMMAIEDGEWIMRGIPENDPRCIRSAAALIEYVDSVGFLPLFKNTLPDFSVEERTAPEYWWTGDARDPWSWREEIARSRKLVYGKLFEHKAGFISLRWLPYFVNARRDGYDFDARWDDGLASFRQKKIMDLFETHDSLFSFEIKDLAGFGKGGEKNFEGTLSSLGMMTYLVMSDFRRRLNKAGEPYGWSIAVYSKPEALWGYKLVSSAYREDPEISRARIADVLTRRYPDAEDKQILKMIRA